MSDDLQQPATAEAPAQPATAEAPAQPALVSTPADVEVHPELVTHSNNLADYVEAELAKHQALLNLVTDVKNSINKAHSDLVTAGQKVVAKEHQVVGYTSTHKLKAALVAVGVVVVAYVVWKLL
jgi:hypothetical protein